MIDGAGLLAVQNGQATERYADAPNPDLLPLIPLKARTVLDVGCGTGALAAAYRQFNPHARLLGIERDPAAAVIARRRLDEVVQADVERDPLPFDVPGGLDCVIYGDVLQQLRNPWAVVRRHVDALTSDGTIVMCVPNVEHWSMVARLFDGTWNYEATGLLDVAHVRWFSVKSLVRTLTTIGLSVEDVRARVFGLHQTERFVATLAPALQTLGIDAREYRERASALQYVLRVRRVGDRGVVSAEALSPEPLPPAKCDAVSEALADVFPESRLDADASQDGIHAPASDVEGQTVTGATTSELGLQFESLGDNCEFGLVQRHLGADPLSLLRFASFAVPLEQRLDRLIAALDRGFDRLAEPGTVSVSVGGPDGHEEYLVRETVYQLFYHTFERPDEITIERMCERETKRLTLLRRKLLEDLFNAEKLFVWKINVAVLEEEVRRILSALRSHGPNTLLWVSEQDPANPPGSVVDCGDGLLRGYVDRFAPYDRATNVSFAAWKELCVNAHGLWTSTYQRLKSGSMIGGARREPLADLQNDPSPGDATPPLVASSGPLMRVHDTPKVACIMMQKDETYLVRPWIAYHGHLFGFENIFIFDNGSETEEVRATLDEFEARGVHVDWSRSTREDYRIKGNIIGDKIQQIDCEDKYDFLMPLDCDEFVILKTASQYACSRAEILSHLSSLVGDPRVLRFPYHLANHPAEPDLYHYFSFFKIFFTTGTFESMDHGHHLGKSRRSEGYKDSNLVHLHFHYKPFELLIEQAKRSWIGEVDYNDREKIATYTGPSGHLAKYFLMHKEDYYANFLQKVHFYFPEFRRLLKELGAPLDLPQDFDAGPSRIVRDKSEMVIKPGAGAPVFTPATAVGGGTRFEFGQFDELAYLNANPDIARAGVGPTAHFCNHGAKEGRPMRPRDEGIASPPAPVKMLRSEEPTQPALGDRLTRELVASYLAGVGPIPRFADGICCIRIGTSAPRWNGWITAEIGSATGALQLDLRYKLPIDNAAFDFAYSEDTIEHLSFESGQSLLKELFRIMKPGGTIRIATPSLSFLLELFSKDRTDLQNRYIQWAVKNCTPGAPKPLPAFILNNFVRAWGHTFIYDEPTLRLAMSLAGFTGIVECRPGESEHVKLRQLESVGRLPDGFVALESMIFEAVRPHD